MKKRNNTDSPFCITVAIVISSPEKSEFTDASDRSIFARVGAFSPNRAPRFRDDNAADFAPGGFIGCVVLAPTSGEYRFANLCSWMRESVKGRVRFARPSVFGQGR